MNFFLTRAQGLVSGSRSALSTLHSPSIPAVGVGPSDQPLQAARRYGDERVVRILKPGLGSTRLVLIAGAHRFDQRVLHEVFRSGPSSAGTHGVKRIQCSMFRFERVGTEFGACNE